MTAFSEEWATWAGLRGLREQERVRNTSVTQLRWYDGDAVEGTWIIDKISDESMIGSDARRRLRGSSGI